MKCSSCRWLHRQSAARDGGSYNALHAFLIVALIVDVVGCTTNSTHQFVQPAASWRTHTGQLMYRNPNRTVIGDAFVRYSTTGDFELTFAKGPVTLLLIREDANFGEVKGALTGHAWSGPIDRAPQQLRGWLELRAEIVRAQNRHLVRHVVGSETFVFRF